MVTDSTSSMEVLSAGGASDWASTTLEAPSSVLVLSPEGGINVPGGGTEVRSMGRVSSSHRDSHVARTLVTLHRPWPEATASRAQRHSNVTVLIACRSPEVSIPC